MIYLIQIKNSFNWTAAGPLAASVPFHTGLDVREFKLRYSNPLDGWGGFSGPILLSPRKPFAFFQRVQIHVVAHVALGGRLQGLVIPRVIGAVAQGLVHHPAAGLGLADVLIKPV